MGRIVCYTAIFGDYDKLIDPLHGDLLIKEADFICFTDNPDVKSDYFKIIVVERKFEDPVLDNRYYKILAHKVLPQGYEYSIYIDGNFWITAKSFKPIIREALLNSLSNIATVRHPQRNCIYLEAEACIRQHKDSVSKILAQVRKYKKEGYPSYNGLAACTFLIRRINSSTEELCEQWWEQVVMHSKRDQISFNYILWLTAYKEIFYLNWKLNKNKLGIRTHHKKKRRVINNLLSYNTSNSFLPHLVNSPPAWAGHLTFASYLVEKFRPKVIVELGTHTGNSLIGFAHALKINELIGSKVYGVDLWHGDQHAGYYDNNIFNELNEIITVEYFEFAKLIRSDFNEAVSHFHDTSIDVLHIDGLHTYDAVRNDFYTWLPKLNEDALVLFHDTEVYREDFGVYKFWDELSLNYPYKYNFSHSNGLGVLSISIDGNSRSARFIESLISNQTLIDLITAQGNQMVDFARLAEENIRLKQKYNSLKKSRVLKLAAKFKVFMRLFNIR